MLKMNESQKLNFKKWKKLPRVAIEPQNSGSLGITFNH